MKNDSVIVLQPMHPANFNSWKAKSLKIYAREKVRSGNWDHKNAAKLARISFNNYLPKGLKTKDQFLFEIYGNSIKKPVGVLWLARRSIEGSTTRCEIFVCDIQISSRHQGKGFGTLVLEAAEDFARSQRADRVSLHVFAHNKGALRLYERLNYKKTNIVLSKDV